MKKKHHPAVSLIVPVYEGRAYFAELVPLLLRQTLKEIEFIFVDDVGTDGAFAIAEAAAKTDKRVVLVKNGTNKGPGYSRNQGLSVARGEYVAFVDADDIIPLDYYERLYSKAMETGALVVKCGRAKQYADGQVELSMVNDDLKQRLANGEHLINAFGWEHTTAIYQREHVLRNKAHNSDARQDEDTTFILTVCYNLSVNQFALVEDLFYFYRVNAASLTRKFDSTYFAELLKSLNDKITHILNWDSSEALDKYVATQIDGHLGWRYKQVLQEVGITRQQRFDYLNEIIKLAQLYRSNRPNVNYNAKTNALIEGVISIEKYTHTLLLEQVHRKSLNNEELALLIMTRYYQRQLRYYRILAWITFGKRKEKIVRRKRQLRACLKRSKEICKRLLKSI